MGASAVPEARVFHTLDALRGVAAIGVVIFHMQLAFNPIRAPGGYLAVDLFFIMSGVVLSHAYEGRFRAGMGTVEFMRVRLIRLYPLYILGTLLGIAVTLASLLGHNSQNWDTASFLQAALRAVFFIPNLSAAPVDQLFPLNIPCWSLFLELLVNFLFVLTWPVLTNRRLIAVALLAAGVVIWAIVHRGNIDQGSTAATLVVGVLRTLFGFSVGVLIARRQRDWRHSVSNCQVLLIAAALVVAITGAPTLQARALWDAICVLVVFPALVCWGTVIDPSARMRRIPAFLGVTSYAVYVLHSPLASLLNSLTRSVSGAGGVAGGAPYLGIAVLAILLTGCWLTDEYFDIPARRYLGRVVPRTRVAARTATSPSVPPTPGQPIRK